MRSTQQHTTGNNVTNLRCTLSGNRGSYDISQKAKRSSMSAHSSADRCMGQQYVFLPIHSSGQCSAHLLCDLSFDVVAPDIYCSKSYSHLSFMRFLIF